jgi:hypothetical protein
VIQAARYFDGLTFLMAQSVTINPRRVIESRPWIVLNSFMPGKIILILGRKF